MMLRFPMTRRTWPLVWIAMAVVATIVTGSWLTHRRQSMGRNIQIQAYICAASQNTAMMEAAGLASEAEDALMAGDMPKYHELQEKVRIARAQENYYANQRREAEDAVSAILGPKAGQSLPPGVQVPVPIY